MEPALDPGVSAALSAVGGYLLGSIPFGLVLTRMAGLGDIRTIGSGNIGATNVLRTGNKPLAAAVLILDSGKGAAAVLIAGMLLGAGLPMVLAGVLAVVGHNFPVWLGFKGGKGVATTLGTLIALSPLVGAAACATWLIVAALFRYSSLAALIALAAAPIYVVLIDGAGIIAPLTLGAAFLAVLAWIRHEANIRRLLVGNEPKIGKK
jgi:glycerol-3-phosphate acyltransferase PlsY